MLGFSPVGASEGAGLRVFFRRRVVAVWAVVLLAAAVPASDAAVAPDAGEPGSVPAVDELDPGVLDARGDIPGVRPPVRPPSI